MHLLSDLILASHAARLTQCSRISLQAIDMMKASCVGSDVHLLLRECHMVYGLPIGWEASWGPQIGVTETTDRIFVIAVRIAYNS